MNIEIKESEFRAARTEQGLTVKQLSEKFGISQNHVKKVIQDLNLPTRTAKKGYILLKDGDVINNVRTTGGTE